VVRLDALAVPDADDLVVAVEPTIRRYLTADLRSTH
jgi:hypothetical protein